jgi:signal transduction histidine kinase/ligand-binding sensor domain-containing protein/DNA-binding response OmpR family regulator
MCDVRRRYWTVVILFFLVRLATAQPSGLPEKEIIFDQLPEKLGLSQSSINCILQDREGFLWIGTWSGLLRYDGYSTVVYHSDNAPNKIKSNKISAIYEDRQGYLWVGTHMGGLFRYDKNKDIFTQFSHHEGDAKSLSHNNVNCIGEDQYGELWVGTENGLNVFDSENKNFTSFFSTPNDTTSLAQNIVTDIFLSSLKELWIATANGLQKVSKDGASYKFKTYRYTLDPANQYHHNYIYKICELPANGKPAIWFCTIRGLKKLQDGVITNYQVPDKPSSFSFIRSMYAVKGARPYIITGSEKGLSFFDPATNIFTKFLDDFDQRVNLSHGTVTALYLDRSGVFWVGTKKGLNKFDSYSKDFQSFKTASFDTGKNIITGLQSSTDQGYWISTIGGGLYKLRREKFQRVRIIDRDDNDFVNFIQTIYTDTRGNVWLGTAGAGVYRFHEDDVEASTGLVKKFEHYAAFSTPSFNSNYIMSLTEDNIGNVWVGTWSGGLYKVTPEGKVNSYSDALLREAPLVVMHADLAGTLWVGTRGNGLYKIKPKGDSLDIRQFHRHDSIKGNLSNNFINAIYEDHAGLLWIGTEGGLNSFDRRTELFKYYKIEEGPSSDVIVSILEDDSGKLWLAHWDGLTVIDPLDAMFVKHYDHHDRLGGGFFYNNVSYKDEKGRLLFGGSEGFNIIDPNAVVTNPNFPKVVINDFLIFNKSVPTGSEFDGRVILDKPLSAIDQVTLKYSQNSISFEFTALDYAAPEKTRYAYMLEGFDKDWNYTDASRRYASYTNLNEGKYTFKVRAANSEGVWDGNVSSVTVVINPPWWKTMWARVIYFVLALGMLHLFRTLVLMRANFRHDLRLERLQRENMEQLNYAKLQFFTNISHEFRTPLTLILGPSQSLLDKGEGGKETRDQLLNINNNAQRLLRLVNQLLDFRKAESGNLKLEVSEGNIVKFIKEVKLSFDTLAEQMRIDFFLYASSNIIKAWFDRDQFEKIMFNLLSNAFKHTPEGGKITMQIVEGQDEISVTVEDNGKGIKREHFDSIFQTFFSYDEDKHNTGTGIGLALAKSLVDMHHGKLMVQSEENSFTRFVITLPKGSAHFDAAELLSVSKDIESMDRYPVLTPQPLFIPGKDTEPIAENLKDLPKLLVVEDNDEVRTYIRSIFDGTYIVLQASEGKEGLDIALEEMPDLVISDVMMPVMDGITLCTQLKSNVKTSHIPVILLTARTSLIFKVEGLETGADDYITKPFNPKVLQLKVRNLMRMRELMRKMFRDNGVLTIEPKRVTLTSADETFVQQALESIEKNMSNPDYAVDDLGRDVGMSRTQLYRKLKALTGQSANEFIRVIRLKRAAQLLEQNQLTIAEVTYEVGFTDLKYFRECFKKLFGVTPSEFVQRTSDDYQLE